jgi:hypothetical protein
MQRVAAAPPRAASASRNAGTGVIVEDVALRSS